jgi:hypothetical protein
VLEEVPLACLLERTPGLVERGQAHGRRHATAVDASSGPKATVTSRRGGCRRLLRSPPDAVNASNGPKATVTSRRGGCRRLLRLHPDAVNAYTRPKATVTLWPPKPRLFESA